MSAQIKAKVTTGIEYNRSRPPSPLKTLPTSASPTLGPRPRAKVNSSATIGARKPVSSTASSLAPTTKTNVVAPRPQVARAPSPFKPAQARSPSPHKFGQSRAVGPVAAQSQTRVKVGTGARLGITAAATPSLPELRERALTTTPADIPDYTRARRGSVSSHVSASPSGSIMSRSAAPSPPKLAVVASEDGASFVAGHVRVKSKVSRLADHAPPQMPQSLPSSPSFQTRPARIPSVSNLSLSPPLAHAAPARPQSGSPIANTTGHGRFASARDPPTPRIAPLQMQPPRDDGVVNYSAHMLPTKVDPTSIPLPPYSPPVSTVSFSSRSSASKSSTSYDTHNSEHSGSTAPNVHARLNGIGHSRTRSSIDGLGIQVSPLSVSREPSRETSPPGFGSDDDHDMHDDNVYEDPERKRRNEAKSNRKIADLEITNKSLLAINSSLEAQKSRQAKEVRDLRRRLREAILVLPPRAYRAAQTSLTEDGSLTRDNDQEDGVEDEEDEDDEEEQAVLDGKTDESYRRVKTLLEALLESGRQALEAKPQDFVGTGTTTTKVLSEEEARKWRRDDTDARSFVDTEDRDDASVYLTADGVHRPLTPSQIAIPDDELDSEDDEIEALSHNEDRDEFRRSQLPPITVTPSPSP